MDLLGGLIGQELARRQAASNARGAETLRAFGIDPGGGAAGQIGRGMPGRQPAPPSLLESVAGAAMGAIPKVGMAIRVLNAGPVADGTFEHARRMGWVK